MDQPRIRCDSTTELQSRGKHLPAPTFVEGLLIQDRYATGLQTGNGNAERRTGNVIQSDPVEEVDRVRIASVLTTDTKLQIFLG